MDEIDKELEELIKDAKKSATMAAKGAAQVAFCSASWRPSNRHARYCERQMRRDRPSKERPGSAATGGLADPQDQS